MSESKSIWSFKPTIDQLHEMGRNSLGESLGIRFKEIGDDFLKATMPVDHRTVQPMRLLHGGASVALAETLGSVAGVLSLPPDGSKTVVGVDINATHMRSVSEGGIVTGTVRPLRIGRTIQVWQIDIHDQSDRMVCSSRLTCNVVDVR